jgi:hypothetical protein
LLARLSDGKLSGNKNKNMMKLLIPIKDVPEGERVTKKTGEKLYTVRDRIRIFSDDVNVRKEIKADDGVRFLVNDNGDVNAVDAKSEYIWYVDVDTAAQWLSQQVDQNNER